MVSAFFYAFIMKKLFTFIFIFSTNICFGQSGWVKTKNQLYTQLSYSFFASEDYYNISGDLLSTNKFSQNNINLYAEYGLGNRLAIQVNYTVLRANSFSSTETVWGGGDVFVGIQYAILKGKFPLSFTIGPQIPLGDRELLAQNNTNPSDQINLPTGDGEWNIWSTLALSHSFHPAPFYASIYSSFNYRTSYKASTFSHQLKNGIEIGYQPISNLWIQGKMAGYQTLGTPNEGIDIFRGEGSEFTSVELAASYPIWKQLQLTANTLFYSDWLISRKNIYSAPVYSICIAFQVD